MPKISSHLANWLKISARSLTDCLIWNFEFNQYVKYCKKDYFLVFFFMFCLSIISQIAWMWIYFSHYVKYCKHFFCVCFVRISLCPFKATLRLHFVNRSYNCLFYIFFELFCLCFVLKATLRLHLFEHPNPFAYKYLGHYGSGISCQYGAFSRRYVQKWVI